MSNITNLYRSFILALLLSGEFGAAAATELETPERSPFRSDPRALEEVRCSRGDLTAFVAGVSGRSVLCQDRGGITGRVFANGLVANDAYTVWWVYFDNPAACVVPLQCGLEDFAGENPLGVFGRMDSLVAGTGEVGMFVDRLRNFSPSKGAQVWLLMFGHGAADFSDRRHLARQLLTPEDPNAGAPHLGNIVDGPLGFPVAVAVFEF